ncbi:MULTISPECIES: hypothetical protein [Sorangium]|uniref:Secreted protein n=1 Tax=Sorangium cellulosum TaxID=56 RepID=A0A4P2QZ84_SORCE|nr:MULTISPECIES: hypothetical protein [Sorangium]AUX35909.1 hypothetical protein SOCE836_081110 [Sorangium cellulosum]WCQ95209.1 hypothetical protein NQZ70_07985 [Sorangium sp. Soce836]
MRAHHIIWRALLLAAAQVPFTVACSSVTDGSDAAETETGTGEDAGTESTSSSSPSGDDTGATDPAVDLFACGLEPSCERVVMHASPTPTEALTCAAKLVVGGGTGVLGALLTPGPYIDETESLLVVLGDGTALVQTRERHCGREGMECGPTLGWEAPSQHRICDLVISPELEEACTDDAEGCSFWPWRDLSNCRAAEEHTCEDIAALLTSQ